MEKIIKFFENDKPLILNSSRINFDELSNFNNDVSKKIMKLLSKEELYPKQIGKKLKIHEQNVYYHIKKLEKAKMIKITKKENINGTVANFYSISSDSFYIPFKEFKEGSKISQKDSDFLKPFVENGELNAKIIVGSPDPHGPQKARSKDGYFGMDIALFLGTFLTNISNSKVMLDTQIRPAELGDENLILIGGPVVNNITAQINKHMTIYFDENTKGIYSKISKKTYFNDEIGIVSKFKSPFNNKKWILFIGGIRNSGTKAAILAFLKHFDQLKEKNIFDNSSNYRIVEGIDMDSDGEVDDCEFLE